METYDLSRDDLSLIKKNGFRKNQIFEQIEKIRRGVLYSELDRPAKLNDGIKSLSKKDEHLLFSIFNDYKNKLKIIKFVPASGAASRMFLDLLTFYNKKDMIKNDFIEDFISGIKNNKFAFIQDLKACMYKNGYNLLSCIKDENIRIILKYLLTEDGLNYVNLPKAVLKFHIYQGIINTPIDEQINEGINYAMGKDGKINLHFSISSEFEQIFLQYIEQALNRLDINKKKIDIRLSEQKANTQTIALNEDNKLFRSIDGDILFRPGGHGALIENLNILDGDIIFIKNIDNVVIEHLSEKSNYYKKVLCGYLINIRNIVFKYAKSLEDKSYSDESLIKILDYCKKSLNISFGKKFFSLDIKEKTNIILNRLLRPIRVCGMVKNEGEPGGGPYWVKKKGDLSLQIIESVSVNNSDKNQINVFNKAEFFNPVDIVCSIKDHNGRKYDLNNFIDNEAFFISEKSKEGKFLKALELPGLWNGAMSDWITVFVEVPIITFNPVKTINDLLKTNHQN